MTPVLPQAFLDVPLAHRALHDRDDGRPENSLTAVRAAVAAGYGIEIDVQLTADDHAVVFHDYGLDRLTQAFGPVRQRTLSDMASIPLTGGRAGAPGLSEILGEVAGKVPLLIELKDQDGALGDDVGLLEAAVAKAIQGYDGPVAVMSFNPHSTLAMQTLAPDVPRGLVTCDFTPADWPVAEDRLQHLANIPDYARVDATFISHDVRDLDRPRVAQLKAEGAAILCWTVRSPKAEAEARKVAQNVTFEGYLPSIRA
jgi:glycerophosphoryl diester phosphodiesterase